MIELKDKPELKSQRTLQVAPEKSALAVCASLASALAGSAITVLVCWVIVESVFAATHVGEDTVAKPDPLLGYSHIEGQNITYRSEGYSRSEINSAGFRDRLYGAKQPGWKRVCVTGDSMTMGLEVPLENTYPKLLEKQLQAEGKKIEVFNCGMSGTGTGQQYLGWRKSIAKMQPDMLIIGYHLGDTDDNVGGGTNPPRPTFMLDSTNNLRIDFKDVDTWFAGLNSRFYSSFAWFRSHSRVLAVLSKLDLDLQADPTYKLLMKGIGEVKTSAWNALLSRLPKGDWKIDEQRTVATDLLPGVASAQPINGTVSRSIGAVAKETASATFAAKPSVLNPNWKPIASTAEHGQLDIDLYRGMIYMHNNRMNVTREILRRLNSECKTQGCKLVVAGLPAYDNTIIYYRELNEIRQLAQEEGFTYIDCWKQYPSRGPLDESAYHFSTHFNNAGHKVMAETLHKNLAGTW